MGTPLRKAAKLYNVPRNSIRDYIDNQDKKKMGCPGKFTQEEEKLIVNTLVEFSEAGMPLNKDHLRDLVHHLSEEKGAIT